MRIGVRLFLLAIQWSREGLPTTEIERLEMVKAIKGRKRTGPVSSLEKALEEVEKAVEVIIQERKLRDQYKSTVCTNSARRIAPISLIPAKDRVKNWSHARVVDALKEIDPLRGDEAPAGCKRTIILTDDLTAVVGYVSETWYDWNVYRGAYKGWKATGVTKRITIGRDWYRAVYKQGLAVIDGLLTLDARSVSSPIDGVSVYAAVWVEQKRGYSVGLKCGYIALSGEVSYHAETLDKALK